MTERPDRTAPPEACPTHGSGSAGPDVRTTDGPAPDGILTVLVAAATNGDEFAWAELVRRYTPLVLSVIRAHRLNRTDAADVNQTVWLRLVEHLDRVREPAALATWLVTTTRRECYRLVRVGRRTQPFDPLDDAVEATIGALLPPDFTAPDENLLRAERRQALRDGFGQLPARCRELLSLLVADPPASYREIAQRLGMPIGSIGPSQARCLRKLRDSPALAAYVGSSSDAEGNGGDRNGAVAAGR
ncbi:sigma-70 family RNA polymerase sigma factor [Micromonospora sp. WMMD1102]|uniref:RNA polymerase sigma factor n=1 Tax=Micromonospora sp. WMMD1102 TaxID=3016105 RepID=UPI00241578BD|nr:sigma-70 family RNA polymerase sigma factor [Micromonospora sp. WMMD1102]MDG4789199.1 sigma-70 family RNA polymerase sigma factor [Micromonospora sp. WMMD1102]